MKRILLTLVPWMALASSGMAQTRFAEVLYTHHDATPVRAFRLGDECFVPLDAIDNLGWQASLHDDRADVKAEGKSFSLPTRIFAGKPAIGIRQAMVFVGGGADWVPRSDTLQVFAPIESVSVRNGHLQASSSIGIKPSLYVLSGPSRLVVDFPGARLARSFKKDLDPGIRVSQYRENVVRVVVEAPNLVEVPKLATEESRDVDLDLRSALEKAIAPQHDPVRVAPTPREQEPVKVPSPRVDTPVTDPKDELKELLMNVDKDVESVTSISIPLKGIAQSEVRYAKPDPSTLEVTLPRINGYLSEGRKVSTDAVRDITVRREGWNTVIVFQLVRPMGAEVVTDVRGLQVRLIKPNVGDGKLAGKVVVVDPGHGGHDTGAISAGVAEKTLTLPIGKYLSDYLAHEGATVIMTRKDDSYPTLPQRADIANKNNADFFISVHINKTGESSGTSGTITFFHANFAVSKLLAECIQHELAKVTQLPNIGVWSDQRIYDSGFSVLRNTPKMPGVLLELGFINNSKDRKRMATVDFQKSAAAAVVKGLKVYLGDGKE